MYFALISNIPVYTNLSMCSEEFSVASHFSNRLRDITQVKSLCRECPDRERVISFGESEIIQLPPIRADFTGSEVRFHLPWNNL